MSIRGYCFAVLLFGCVDGSGDGGGGGGPADGFTDNDYDALEELISETYGANLLLTNSVTGQNCGGFFTTSRFVATAAHCVTTVEGGVTQVQPAQLDVQVYNRTNNSYETIPVTAIARHPSHMGCCRSFGEGRGDGELHDVARLTVNWSPAGTIPVVGSAAVPDTMGEVYIRVTGRGMVQTIVSDSSSSQWFSLLRQSGGHFRGGDSGTFAFVTSDSGLSVVGVMTAEYDNSGSIWYRGMRMSHYGSFLRGG